MIKNIKSVVQLVTESGMVAEGIFLTFKAAESLLEPTVKLFIYHQVCIRMIEGSSEKLCNNLSEQPKLEYLLQKEAAMYLILYKVILSFPALLLCVFCGSWSDRVGRKYPVIISCSLSILGAFIFMVAGFVPVSDSTEFTSGEPSEQHSLTNVTRFTNNSSELSGLHQQGSRTKYNAFFVTLIFMGSLLRGLSGKSSLVNMAVHSYVSDTSNKDNRTQRLGRLLSMNFFGLFIGALSLGILMQILPFYSIFIVVIFLYFIAIAMAHFLMENTLHIPRSEFEEDNSTDNDKQENDFHGVAIEYIVDQNDKNEAENEKFDDDENEILDNIENKDFKSELLAFFSLKFCVVKDFFAILIEFGKKKVLFYFIVLIVQQTCKSGEVDIILLFTAKSPLNWSKSLYGYFLAVDYACLGLACGVFLPILINFFKTEDISLAVIGMAFKVVRLIILALSNSTEIIFLAAVVCSPSALIISSFKSIISKSFNQHELGKVFAFLSGTETFSSLVGNVLFNSLYLYTINIYAGLTFLLDATLFCIMLFVLVISETIKRSSNKEITEYSEDKNIFEEGIENTAFSKQEDYGSINAKN